MPHEFVIRGDFSVVAESDYDFIVKLQQSARFLPRGQGLSLPDYMDGYSKRTWTTFGVVIRTSSPEDFVSDLVFHGLLTKTGLN